MTISNICVGVVVFLCIMFVSFMFGGLVAFMTNNDDLTTFYAWMTVSLGLAVCMVIIFIQNNLI